MEKLQNSELIFIGDSLTDTFNNVYCNENLSKQDKKNCAPITNGNGTWAAILSELVGHCQRGYSNTKSPANNQIKQHPTLHFQKKMQIMIAAIAKHIENLNPTIKLRGNHPAMFISPKVMTEVYPNLLTASI